MIPKSTTEPAGTSPRARACAVQRGALSGTNGRGGDAAAGPIAAPAASVDAATTHAASRPVQPDCLMIAPLPIVHTRKETRDETEWLSPAAEQSANDGRIRQPFGGARRLLDAHDAGSGESARS